jgi:hypothetical protein
MPGRRDPGAIAQPADLPRARRASRAGRLLDVNRAREAAPLEIVFGGDDACRKREQPENGQQVDDQRTTPHSDSHGQVFYPLFGFLSSTGEIRKLP